MSSSFTTNQMLLTDLLRARTTRRECPHLSRAEVERLQRRIRVVQELLTVPEERRPHHLASCLIGDPVAFKFAERRRP